MKNVIVFDSYERVYDKNNELIHDALCSKNIDSLNLNFTEACNRVSSLFDASKLLGDFTEITSQPENGVIEIKIRFKDKRLLHRVIYLEDA